MEWTDLGQSYIGLALGLGFGFGSQFNNCYIEFTVYDRSGGSMVRVFAPQAGGCGFDPRPCHTKDVIKMVPDTSLLSAQYIRTGLASLPSQTLLKMN